MGKKQLVNFLIVQEFLNGVGGKYAVELVKICDRKKKSITDEEIGKKLPLKITEIRTVLNRLHYRGIACYQKSRNNKTGWYSYTWEIKKRRVVELILEKQKEEIEKLEDKVAFEKNYSFFSCKNNCSSFPFEVAAEYQFKCPECGGDMNSVDNKKRVRELKKKINLVKSEVIEIQKI